MKTLYYTVVKQLENIDGFEETNGYKDINVYSIKNDKLVTILTLEVVNTVSTEEEILDELPEHISEVKLVPL